MFIDKFLRLNIIDIDIIKSSMEFNWFWRS